MSNADTIIANLKKLKNQSNIEGLSRFGINPESALGISVTTLRKKAKQIGGNHQIALELWDTGIHEARILATMVDDYQKVTKRQMNSWVKDFNSWDLCDQCCNNLFRKTNYAVEYSFRWSKSEDEFIKRAGFTLIAVLAVHSKQLKNEDFIKYFPEIIQHSDDERNFVKKSVNWALRQIGKRNIMLNKEAVKVAQKLISRNLKPARWIGKDALRELTSEKTLEIIKKSV